MRWSRVALVAGVLGLSGCATLRGPPPPSVMTELGPVRLQLEEWTEATQELLLHAIPAAATPVTRWGHLEEPVRIVVVNAHWELEEKAGRSLPGVSAWATRNQILLQDPRWWPMPPSVENEPALEAQVRRKLVTQLLTHELTHCLMFQLAGPTPTEPRDRIPFWFREGMGTVTAGEGSQWPSMQSLAAWLASRADHRLLALGNAIAHAVPPQIAYGAAFHAFEQLDRAHGDAAVGSLLVRMRAGAPFGVAFDQTYGLDEAQFASKFDRSLSPEAVGNN